MKRFFAFALAVLMIGALMSACGKKSQATVTVSAEYDDGYAEQFASSTSTDDDGNKVYVFSDDQYEEYKTNHRNTLGSDIQHDLAAGHDEAYGEYAYINEEKKAVIVGVHQEEYDEETASAEAASAAEYGFTYFQNLEEPISAIKVLYVDAGNQDIIYGSFDFTID